MPMTTSDITGNADLFRAAYPVWPHPAPPAGATFKERNQWLRTSLAGRIEVLVPDETDPESARLYADERADYTEG